jgi:hypothetical protein
MESTAIRLSLLGYTVSDLPSSQGDRNIRAVVAKQNQTQSEYSPAILLLHERPTNL